MSTYPLQGYELLGQQAEGAHGELQQAQSVQEAAPAQAPEKEQQVPKPDEDLTGQPSLSPESPEQPQQIEPGVQVLLASVMCIHSYCQPALHSKFPTLFPRQLHMILMLLLDIENKCHANPQLRA